MTGPSPLKRFVGPATEALAERRYSATLHEVQIARARLDGVEDAKLRQRGLDALDALERGAMRAIQRDGEQRPAGTQATRKLAERALPILGDVERLLRDGSIGQAREKLQDLSSLLGPSGTITKLGASPSRRISVKAPAPGQSEKRPAQPSRPPRLVCPACNGDKAKKAELCERCARKFAVRVVYSGGFESNRRRH